MIDTRFAQNDLLLSKILRDQNESILKQRVRFQNRHEPILRDIPNILSIPNALNDILYDELRRRLDEYELNRNV
jgi:hypothetical protein